MKQTLFLAVATLGASVSFAQLGVGVTGNAGASATKSVNAATTGAATQAATKASSQSVIHSKGTINAAGTKAADIKTQGRINAPPPLLCFRRLCPQ